MVPCTTLVEVTVPFWTTVYVRAYDSFVPVNEVPSTTVMKFCMLGGREITVVPLKSKYEVPGITSIASRDLFSRAGS